MALLDVLRRPQALRGRSVYDESTRVNSIACISLAIRNVVFKCGDPSLRRSRSYM